MLSGIRRWIWDVLDEDGRLFALGNNSVGCIENDNAIVYELLELIEHLDIF